MRSFLTALLASLLLAGSAAAATPTSLEIEFTEPTTVDCAGHPTTVCTDPGCDPVVVPTGTTQCPTEEPCQVVCVPGSALDDLDEYRLYMTGTAQAPCPNLSYTAFPAPSPAPGPNSTFRRTITGLTPGTTYRAQVTAVDTSGNESACSEVAIGTTLDAVPPANVTDVRLTLKAQEDLVALAVDETQNFSGDGVNSITSAGLAVDAGDTIVVVSFGFSAGTNPTVVVSDDVNGTHTQAAKILFPLDNAIWGAVHYFQNSGADADLDATVNPDNDPHELYGTVLEISGAATSGGAAGQNTATSTGTTASVTIGSLPSGDYIIVGGAGSPSALTSAGTQTEVFAPITGVSFAYRIQTGVTSVSLSWTLSSDVWIAWAVAIPVAPAGGISIPVVMHHRMRNF